MNTVLFPGGRLPLRIFEQRYMEMAKACLREASPFGVCSIREGQEVGAPAVPAAVGCLALIGEWDMPQLGLLQVVARGGQRFRIAERWVQPDGLTRARVETIEDDRDGSIPASCATCARLLERVIEQQPGLVAAPHSLESASWVSARLAEVLPLPLAQKQDLLEMTDAVMRLERINTLLHSSSAAAS